MLGFPVFRPMNKNSLLSINFSGPGILCFSNRKQTKKLRSHIYVKKIAHHMGFPGDIPESLRAGPTHCDTYTGNIVGMKMAPQGTLRRQH